MIWGSNDKAFFKNLKKKTSFRVMKRDYPLACAHASPLHAGTKDWTRQCRRMQHKCKIGFRQQHQRKQLARGHQFSISQCDKASMLLLSLLIVFTFLLAQRHLACRYTHRIKLILKSLGTLGSGENALCCVAIQH